MKLYLVVLRSMSAGLKAAQACHALHAFTSAYPEVVRIWEQENNIVVLDDRDPETTVGDLERRGFAVARFHEPDLDNVLTAFCAEPAAGRWLSSLPLAR